MELNENKLAMLVQFMADYITPKELAGKTNLNLRTVREYCAEMVKQGMAIKEDSYPARYKRVRKSIQESNKKLAEAKVKRRIKTLQEEISAAIYKREESENPLINLIVHFAESGAKSSDIAKSLRQHADALDKLTTEVKRGNY